MSPEFERRAPTRANQALTPDEPRLSNESAPRLTPSRQASGRLPQERGTGLSSLSGAFGWVAVASAAVFTACGLWQVGAIISRAQEVAHEVLVAPGAAPAQPHAREAPASAAPVAVLTAPAAVARGAQVDPEKGGSASTAPVLTAARSSSKAGSAAGAFEAQAEASERVILVGLDTMLDGRASALTLGQPPPPDYPRVGCKDIFVYIVTVADGAPRRSAASLGIGKNGPARFRRPGGTIGGWTVLAITDDSFGLNPSVWLEKDGAACRAELAGNPSRIHQTPKPRRKARRKRRR